MRRFHRLPAWRPRGSTRLGSESSSIPAPAAEGAGVGAPAAPVAGEEAAGEEAAGEEDGGEEAGGAAMVSRGAG